MYKMLLSSLVLLLLVSTPAAGATIEVAVNATYSESSMNLTCGEKYPHTTKALICSLTKAGTVTLNWKEGDTDSTNQVDQADVGDKHSRVLNINKATTATPNPQPSVTCEAAEGSNTGECILTRAADFQVHVGHFANKPTAFPATAECSSTVSMVEKIWCLVLSDLPVELYWVDSNSHAAVAGASQHPHTTAGVKLLTMSELPVSPVVTNQNNPLSDVSCAVVYKGASTPPFGATTKMCNVLIDQLQWKLLYSFQDDVGIGFECGEQFPAHAKTLTCTANSKPQTVTDIKWKIGSTDAPGQAAIVEFKAPGDRREKTRVLTLTGSETGELICSVTTAGGTFNCKVPKEDKIKMHLGEIGDFYADDLPDKLVCQTEKVESAPIFCMVKSPNDIVIDWLHPGDVKQENYPQREKVLSDGFTLYTRELERKPGSTAQATFECAVMYANESAYRQKCSVKLLAFDAIPAAALSTLATVGIVGGVILTATLVAGVVLIYLKRVAKSIDKWELEDEKKAVPGEPAAEEAKKDKAPEKEKGKKEEEKKEGEKKEGEKKEEEKKGGDKKEGEKKEEEAQKSPAEEGLSPNPLESKPSSLSTASEKM